MSENATPVLSLPHWDLTPIFPSLQSPEYKATFDKTISEIKSLGEMFDTHNIRRRETPEVTPEFVSTYEAVLAKMGSLYENLRKLGAYIGCHTSTNAADAEAQAEESRLDAATVPLSKLSTRYVAWVGSSDTEALIASSEIAKVHAFSIRRAAYQEKHQMSEAEEAIASDLAPTSITAWAKLHSNLTALLSVEVEIEGEKKTLPMSSIRSLASDPDRVTRKAAYDAEIAAWKTVSLPLAAALNGVKGYQTALRRKRDYAGDVEPTLVSNSIDADTLKAMQTACVESFPDFRRYMTAKAKALKVENMAWYDLVAPVGEATKNYSWDEAKAFIRTNFGRYSEKLSAFAERSFSENWIDAEPHVGKTGGAYCTGLTPGVSRVFMNYNGSFGSISTLAHELGHAYHNLCLEKRTPFQRSTPMTLAETASIFCETIAFDGALETATPTERLALLDTALERNLAIVVDIHSRFLFEQRVFEKRGERDLTEQEFSDLMTQAQRDTYGEDLQELHPFMWAVKGHYYGPLFYNYPYTFGLLFATGLYAQYRQNPETFKTKYDDLLSSTGMADAKTLGAEFGLDTTSIEFWRASLDIIREQIAEFEKLVGV